MAWVTTRCLPRSDCYPGGFANSSALLEPLPLLYIAMPCYKACARPSHQTDSYMTGKNHNFCFILFLIDRRNDGKNTDLLSNRPLPIILCHDRHALSIRSKPWISLPLLCSQSTQPNPCWRAALSSPSLHLMTRVQSCLIYE